MFRHPVANYDSRPNPRSCRPISRPGCASLRPPNPPNPCRVQGAAARADSKWRPTPATATRNPLVPRPKDCHRKRARHHGYLPGLLWLVQSPSGVANGVWMMKTKARGRRGKEPVPKRQTVSRAFAYDTDSPNVSGFHIRVLALGRHGNVFRGSRASHRKSLRDVGPTNTPTVPKRHGGFWKSSRAGYLGADRAARTVFGNIQRFAPAFRFTARAAAAKIMPESGRVAELADAKDLGSFGAILAGSTPVAPTIEAMRIPIIWGCSASTGILDDAHEPASQPSSTRTFSMARLPICRAMRPFRSQVPPVRYVAFVALPRCFSSEGAAHRPDSHSPACDRINASTSVGVT